MPKNGEKKRLPSIPRPRDVWWLLSRAALAWQNDRAALFGAAIAFYAVFSLAPMLLIAIAVAGAVYGDEAAQGVVVEEMAQYVGPDSARAVQKVIAHARPSTESLAATLLGLFTIFLGATRAFGSLKGALDHMWGATTPSERFFLSQMAFDRLRAFLMVLLVGLLLVLLLAAGTLLTALNEHAPWWLPEGAAARLLSLLEVGLSLGVTMLLFALVYRVLPATRVEWRDVWLGAGLGAVLFTAGNSLITWYLGRSSFTSLFGAAGSLIVIMLWVYYSAQILLFGAEVTEVYARRWGSHARRKQAA